MCCYHALMGLPERCENCPSARIRQTRNDSTLIYNSKFDLNVFAEATLIQWQGEESCLLTCRKLPGKLPAGKLQKILEENGEK